MNPIVAFLSILLLVAVQACFAQVCVDARVGVDRRVCSNMSVVFSKITRTSELIGMVTDVEGNVVPEAVLELYESNDAGHIVMAYKTDETGRFCIKNLPKGKYVLKVGSSRVGFNCADRMVEISGRTKRFLRIALELGF